MRKDRKGNPIQTFTGKYFWPLDPCPNEVDIKDIAHHLSNICRFTGAVRHFYCVTPDSKILMEDLTWRPAGFLNVGDRIIGLDESTSQEAPRRRLCRSTVKFVDIIHRPCYRLVLEDGTELESSSDHPWLTSTMISKNQKWETSERIANAINGTHLARGRPRKGKRYMSRFLVPWESPDSRDVGYISGIFDGEGHISRHSGLAFSCGMAQKAGVVLDNTKNILRKYGFDFSEVTHENSVHQIIIRGTWAERLRFLGVFRPARLIQRLNGWFELDFMRLAAKAVDRLEVVEAHFQGQRPVVALETSSKTYFANGFGAHNSVAQHSVLMSRQFNYYPENIQSLIHDASEAYICDMARPVKESMPDYRGIEERLMFTIAEKFELPWPFSKSIKWADTRMLLTEKRDLMPGDRAGEQWDGDGLEPYPWKIVPWTPEQAEFRFLSRFEECKL